MEFNFDKIFSDSITNEGVFNKSVKPNLIKALDGFNFSVMAYGQTVRYIY